MARPKIRTIRVARTPDHGDHKFYQKELSVTAAALSFAPSSIYKQSLSKMKGYQMAKKSKRRAWTKADVRTLKALAKKKTRASSIARTLKRTEGATRQRAFTMGLSLDSR
jgi:hypothetical protein